MSVFLFIGGVTAVAGGTLAALYYLVGPARRDADKERQRRPPKKQLLSQGHGEDSKPCRFRTMESVP